MSVNEETVLIPEVETQEIVEPEIKQEFPKPKPKRQLTEAQRLAFIKGREKRLANLVRKRKEKEEEKLAAAISDSMESPTTTAPASSSDTTIESELTDASPMINTQHEEVAKKVADLIYKRLSEEEHEEPPSKPKRKYTKRTKKVPVPEVILDSPTPIASIEPPTIPDAPAVKRHTQIFEPPTVTPLKWM